MLLAGSKNFEITYSNENWVVPILVFLLLTFIFYAVYRVKEKEDWTYKFLFYSFLLKILGNILTALMYGAYYGYGDTFGYFAQAQECYQAFINSPLSFFKNFDLVDGSVGRRHVYNIAYVLSIFTFKSYLAISILFTSLAVVGNWLIYRVFIDLYPKYSKKIFAYCILYVPSIWFWGNGLQKESLMLFGLGYFFYLGYQIIKRKKVKFTSLLLLPFAYYCIMVKSYALYLIILLLLLWLVFEWIQHFKLVAFKVILISFVSIVFVGGTGFYFYQSGGAIDLLLEESSVVDKAMVQAKYLTRISEEKSGSAYDLGPIDNSLEGLLSKVLPAINVTLFRPYLWEATKAINIPAAIESFGLFLMFILVLWRTRIYRLVKILFNDPFLLSSFIYCLLFSFIVGLTSVNYGALVRYKLPVVIFIYAIFYILLIKSKKLSEKL